jgi:protein gp37
MTDIFHQNIPDQFIWKLFDIMINTPQHTYQVLTKRPERMIHFFKNHINSLTPNIWIGTSVENQQTADERIPFILQVNASVRFVSCEPLLGPVDLKPYLSPPAGEMSVGQRGVKWVIVGGESGPGARPMHPDWPRSLRDQCQEAGVPFFFKQWGEYTTIYPQGINLGNIQETYQIQTVFYKTGKKAAGRLLDGREWNEYPMTND